MAVPAEQKPVARRRLRPPPLAAAALVLAAVLAGLVIYGVTKPAAHPSLQARLESGKLAPAPPFDLPLLGGAMLDRGFRARHRRVLADSRLTPGELRGNPVVVNFWASWCVPCRLEAPLLARTWRRERGRIDLVGLNMQDSEANALRFMRRFGVSYPNVRDRRDAVARRWGLKGIPQTYFLRSDGRVVAFVIGRIRPGQMAAGLRAARNGRVLGSFSGGASQPPR